MLRKIILPVVLLIFTQQNFYGMNNNKYNIQHTKNTGDKIDGEQQTMNIWETLDSYCNREHDKTKKKFYPRLWLLWAIVDNVPLQYGNSKKIWENGEAYYGLSNGICFFFPSFLNFEWLKVGIIDVHINVINLILVGFKHLIKQKSFRKDDYSVEANILYPLYYNSVITGIHLLSFNFLNCVKVKIISIGAIILKKMEKISTGDDIGSFRWYHVCSAGCYNLNNYGLLSSSYLLLSPRIEINISEIIKHFNGK